MATADTATMTSYTHCFLTWLTPATLPEVVAIEAVSYYYPRGEAALVALLAAKHCVGMVAKRGETVLGYYLYSFVDGGLDLHDLAVRDSHRRQGIGYQMAARLVGKLGGDRTRIVADLRETNLPGAKYLAAQGFRATGVIRGHYADSGEDCYRFVYSI